MRVVHVANTLVNWRSRWRTSASESVPLALSGMLCGKCRSVQENKPKDELVKEGVIDNSKSLFRIFFGIFNVRAFATKRGDIVERF